MTPKSLTFSPMCFFYIATGYYVNCSSWLMRMDFYFLTVKQIKIKPFSDCFEELIVA